MLAFGMLGYFMRSYGYQVGPVILGVILSRLIDENWRRAIISEQGSLTQFFVDLISSPLSPVLLLAALAMLFTRTPAWPALRRRLARRAQE